MKLIQILTDLICNTLFDHHALDRAHRQKGAFTRNCGKLPYWTLVKLLLGIFFIEKMCYRSTMAVAIFFKIPSFTAISNIEYVNQDWQKMLDGCMRENTA